MNWLIDRLKEKSTWLAIFTFAGLFGIKLEPELRETIINAIIAVAAVAAFVFKEKPDAPDISALPPIELQGQSESSVVSVLDNTATGNDPVDTDNYGVMSDASVRRKLRNVQADRQSESGWNG